MTAITAVGALVFTGLSLNAARDQNAIQQQGQFTDRYGKAVEQLGRQGAENLQIRLGGIYALERLARDSARDQPTIIEVLSAFVRTSPSTAERCELQTAPSVDVQAAVRVLGRRDPRHDGTARVDLRSACLVRLVAPGIHLANADLSYTKLHEANLAGANLDGAQLRHVTLRDANLQYASLQRVTVKLPSRPLIQPSTGPLIIRRPLEPVVPGPVTDANLERADLIGADLRYAELERITLEMASLENADLSSAQLPGTNLRRATLYNTNLEGSNLDSASLEGASLWGARHNESTNIRGASTDSFTGGEWW